MGEQREQLRQRQREALWKWRWLGWRESTPGFKGTLIILAVVVILVALYGAGVL